MANPANSVIQNLLPVQAYFSVDGVFQTFIGQGQPFYATFNPSQSGLTITNSTIDSSTIGATSPSTGVFTNIATTTGTISTSPSANTDIANKYYVDAVAQGLGPKAACAVGTTTNITLSGLQTIDGYTTLFGDRVLVKNQTSSQFNGIYVASASTWTRAVDMDVWAEVSGAYTVILNGGQANTGYVCTASKTGTIDVTAMPWVQFSGTSTYFAGTGLTLASNTFSITNTGVTAASVGSASKTLTATVNAQGQLTALADTNIAIGASQITSGTIASSLISGSYTGITGVGTLTAGTWNASTIGVAYGGTGAVTLTGYVKGSGTSAFTAATTIPNTDITGLGTMSTQNANSVAITGGSISGLSSFILTGQTGYVYANGSSAVTSSTTIPTSALSGNFVSTFSAGTTGLTPSSNTAGAVTLAGTLNVANGGTGVTSSSGANSVVLRDANGNITTNCLFEGYTTQAASGTTITLVASSAQNYQITGSGGQVIKLPDATTLPNGATFTFNNNQSSGAITVQNNSATTVATIQSGGYVMIVLLSNSTAAGSWDRHDSTPSNVSWSTNTLDYPGSITSATWNGNTIAINRGGTNGTATPTAGAIAYGTGTAYAFTSAGSSGQVLTSSGSGTPTWSTPTSYATVTDDTTTNAVRYPLYAAATSGNLTTEYVASTKYQFNPSTGVLTATQFTGSGAGLTSIPNSALTNSSITVGSTAISLGGSATTIAGLTSVTSTTFVGALTGNASTATSATTATNATNIAITDNTSSVSTYYPVISSATTGNVGATTSSTKLSFVPNTGVLSATSFTGAGTGLTGTASSLSIGGNALNVTGTVAIANGGTGQTTQQAALTALSGTQTSGQYLRSNGTNTLLSAIQAADVPTLNQNTTGTASNVTGTVVVANGGTGVATLTGVAYGNGTSAFTAATGSQIATAIGSTAVTNATNATNIAGGANLQIPYNTGAGATSFIAAPTIATTYLQYNGTGFAWATVSATTATNLAGGTLGSIPYQSALNTTLFLAGNATTTPQFVTSTGVAGLATAPTLTGSTGSGNVVLATSPTLVTPALGTPTAIVLTNASGTASININGTVGATTANTGAFTTVSATGVITSTVATGTAPFTVSSTTAVANLSIGGNAATATSATTATNATNTGTTDDNATNAVMYPVWKTANSGNLPEYVSSTKLKFNPSTGALTANQLIIAP